MSGTSPNSANFLNVLVSFTADQSSDSEVGLGTLGEGENGRKVHTFIDAEDFGLGRIGVR